RGDAAHLARLVSRLGATAVPLLGRELRSCEPVRREAARDALAAIAAQGPPGRARVTAELHAITEGAVADEAKVVALGLLAELGEHADARFADPAGIRMRAAVALAAQLETAADLAGAADLMVHQLEADDIVQMLEAMADAAPLAAHRLAGELTLRLDVASDVRDRIALVIAAVAPRLAATPVGPASARKTLSAPTVVVLVDAAARLVVIASRRIARERRWRRWAVLIGAAGRIDDCLHEDDAGDEDASSLIGRLCAEGYRIASTDPERAHEVVAAAARRTAESTHALPSAYYLGRDLLDLADAHWSRDTLGERHGDPASAALPRAIELLAAGDHARALPLLERCDPDHPDAAAALAAALITQGRPGAALLALDRALAVEPEWPLHHWNLAAALHALGDMRSTYHALRRFVATSAAPSGLAADPDQPGRIASAERMIAELERAARLSGSSLGSRPLRRRRSPRSTRKRRSTS
ncbi:MAG TPA: tetratricopeptide repeat protein, partial [Kofleriaceae bacterium]|nr:tetratricopeptide repeat protein [Kofleriaceae bacterium]